MTTILQIDGGKLNAEQLKTVLDQVKLAVDFGKHCGRFALGNKTIEYDLREVLAAEAACEEGI